MNNSFSKVGKTADAARLANIVGRALEEDIGTGDATTEALVPADAKARAIIFARSQIVVSGCEVAATVFNALDPGIVFSIEIADGDRAEPDRPIATIEGSARAILTGERTALNFMQRMSGIATLTSKFVELAKPHGVSILDTRKTTPLLRDLEKYAVRCGGGENHRFGLFDRILIKDNHRNLWARGANGDVGAAVEAARRARPGIPIEVEVESEDELRSALKAKPDWILLDNIPASDLNRFVAIAAGRCQLEVSGGVNLDTIKAVVLSGVDVVSLGCLTHSAPAADLSLEIMGSPRNE